MFEFRPPAVVQADAALAVALRAGDEGAVRSLFARYGGLVQAVALDAAGPANSEPADSAERITLHTFLQAWRNSEAFEPGRSFAPWLATLAGSVAHAAGADVAQPRLEALLADPMDWAEPPAGLEDRVVAAVTAEAHVDPADVYTAADLEAARSGAPARSTTLRSAVLGVVVGLGLLLVGIIALSALDGSSGTATTTIDLRPTGRVVDAEGTIVVEPLDAGLSIELETSPLPDVGGGGSYRAIVIRDDGTIVPAGSFLGGDDDVSVALWAAVPPDADGQFAIVVTTDAAAADGFEESDVVLRGPLP